MGFYSVLERFREFDAGAFLERVTDSDVTRILAKERIDVMEYLALLSPAASRHIEEMAARANDLTTRHFGKGMILFTPLYISNHCVNRCAYCSYNAGNDIRRKRLDMGEIDEEASAIAGTGLRHILLLTGESRKESDVGYIKDAVSVLRKRFESISIEIYPLNEDEYGEVVSAGVDGLTMYQESYDEDVYDRVHLSGPKKDFRYRLEAPERACRAGIRSLNIGALLGLADPVEEAFRLGLHSDYLERSFSQVELGISLPRIRPHVGSYDDLYPVSDRYIVQVMTAFRIFKPSFGITVSTRESARLRDNLVGLGVTRMSAGVSTHVGRRDSDDSGDSQFEISDIRSVGEMKRDLERLGYQAIFKDWQRF